MIKFFFFINLILLFFVNPIYAEDKIVFIDMNYILNNSQAGKNLKSQLNERNKIIKIKLKNFQN